MNRAVTLAHFHIFAAADFHLDGGLGQGQPLSRIIAAAFVDDAVTVQTEIFWNLPQSTADQQLEAGRGLVIGIAFVLQMLNQIHQIADRFGVKADLHLLHDRHQRVAANHVHVDAQIGHAGHQIRAPRLIGHQNMTDIAHRSRVNVLVTPGVFGDGRNMQTAFVGKG